MKFTLAVICLLTTTAASTQRTIPTTDTLKITGAVANDIRSGRRYEKGLAKIVVTKVE